MKFSLKRYFRMLIKRRRLNFFRLLILLIFLSFLTMFIFKVLSERFYFEEISVDEKTEELKIFVIDRSNYPTVTNLSRKDWHDWCSILSESYREGAGENGAGVTLTSTEDIEKNEEARKIDGLSVVASSKISVERSIPDTRPEK